MATITFRSKVITRTQRHYINVPEIHRKHCDMKAFREHKRFGSVVNSDLFETMINNRVTSIIGRAGVLWLDSLPDCVSVQPGFLATVTIEIP